MLRHTPSLAGAGWAAFAFAVAYSAVCFIQVGLLYCRRIFVKA